MIQSKSFPVVYPEIVKALPIYGPMVTRQRAKGLIRKIADRGVIYEEAVSGD